MDADRFDALARAVTVTVTASGSRRALVGALAAGAGCLRGAAGASGKKRRKKDKKRCRTNGSRCKKKSANCKAQFCLKTPFTIEARWSNPDTDHDTFLFVPAEVGSLDPSPYIDFQCRPDNSDCETNVYPFACVSDDAVGPGDEITTIRKVLPGTYEYWVELSSSAPAADLTVLLRNANGTVLRGWTSPANPAPPFADRGWHVFDIDGAKHSFTSIDQLRIDGFLPEVAHGPATFVCP
ncbi:MAG: hypothetical protein ACRDJC_26365 [Thermomicrobiales bacterium]